MIMNMKKYVFFFDYFLVGCGKKSKYSNESNLTVLQIDWDNICLLYTSDAADE